MDHHRLIASARAYRGQTQQQLADALTAETGEQWDRNAVAAIENGRRAFTVATMVAVAKCQDMPLSYYTTSPEQAGGDKVAAATPSYLQRAARMSLAVA